MNKLIFLDVDGTLVDYQGNLPVSAVRAVDEAHEAGNQVFLCTGRSMMDAGPIRDAVKADGVIGGGGTYIEDNGQVIAHSPIPEDAERAIVDWLLERGLEIVVETNSGMYASDGFPEAAKGAAYEYRNGLNGVPHPAGPIAAAYLPAIATLGLPEDSGPVRHISAPLIVGESLYRNDANKVSVLLNTPDDVEAARRAFPDMRVAPWGGAGELPLFAEISVNGIDKATAVRRLVEHRGGNMDDTIAFGDAAADAPMLEACKVGVAMGGSGDEARRAADIVAGDVEDDGLYEAFSELGLLTQPS